MDTPTENQPARYEAVIIDSDPNSRSRLKAVARCTERFGRFSQFADSHTALAALDQDLRCDIVFMAHRTAQGNAAQLIRRIRRSAFGKHASIILVLDADHQSKSDVATHLLGGADGFLLEPFSVQSLVDTTRVANHVKRNGLSSREKIAFGLLIKEIRDQINLIAGLKARGYEPRIGMKILREVCTVLETLEETELDQYCDLLVEAFTSPAAKEQTAKATPTCTEPESSNRHPTDALSARVGATSYFGNNYEELRAE